MAQHDYVIANGTGAAVRSDLNNALSAIVSNNSGAIEPTPTYAYQWWADTTTGLLKIRNAANNAWVTVGTLASANLGLLSSGGTVTAALGSASTPGITFTGDTNTGIYSPGADQVAISTNGSGRLFVDASGRVGVGTSSPATGAALTVNGGIFSTSSITAAATNACAVDYLSGSSATRIISYGPSTSNNGIITFLRSDGTTTTENARFDASGRLGIGTTSPTANRKLTLKSGGGDAGLSIVNTADDVVGLIVPENTTTSQELGIYALSNMRLYTGGTQRATIDTSGRLLVGTSTARAFGSFAAGGAQVQIEGAAYQASSLSLVNNQNATDGPYLLLGKSRGTAIGSSTVVSNGDLLGALWFNGADGTDLKAGARIEAYVDATPGANDMPGRLVFSVTPDGSATPVERLRLSNNGDTSLFVTGGSGLQSRSSAAASTANSVFSGWHSATSTGNGSTSFVVYTNGNVQNTNNSYAGFSDIKLKENIVDAGSQWDDLKALQVRKYNFKEGQTHTQIGLVAQEVELVSPGLVTESPDRDEEGNDLGTTTKAVQYSVLYMKAVKALQEAMERIETLESEMAEVKAQLS